MAGLAALLVTFLELAILARVLLSWFPNASMENPLVSFIFQVTEPILAPLRRVIPRLGMFDLTPMIAIVLVAVIGQFLVKLLPG